MNTKRACGAVDQAAFERVIRENLSPEGVAAVIAYLRLAEPDRAANERSQAALRQVEWLADTLTELLGLAEHNRLLEELDL